jgi:aspartyl-tRNA(Asn)/glutamyl-tRNA(Gln) amidotransferase subunit B
MQWETVIGLEVHVQLKTKSKIFSGAATAYGAEPNTQACAIDLGLPGVLPVLNEEAVRMAIKFGLAIDAKVAPRSVFDRKNYFYPDLPKGYQISQFTHPIVIGGTLSIDLEDGKSKTIAITRAHLEEDAGKSLHEDFSGMSGIDLNRAGTPLLEIVSEPEMRSAAEAVAYLKILHSLVKYLDICDGNMQEGSFRCDANVSVRPFGQEKFGTRAEIKNVNSFKFVEKAINYEVERQIAILESGGKVDQETRLFDSQKNETRTMRSKEEANDYRYFPDPDLLPLEITPALMQQVQASLPELPAAKRSRFVGEFSLSDYEAKVLTSSKALANFYEETVKITGTDNAKLTANWVIGEVNAALNKTNSEIEDAPITAKQLGLLIQRIADNTISGKIAKTVFESMWESKQDPDVIIDQQGLKQVTDSSAIEKIIDDVISTNPKQTEEYRNGKEQLFGYFVGQVMKASQGKANPDQVNKLLKSKLAS